MLRYSLVERVKILTLLFKILLQIHCTRNYTSRMLKRHCQLNITRLMLRKQCRLIYCNEEISDKRFNSDTKWGWGREWDIEEAAKIEQPLITDKNKLAALRGKKVASNLSVTNGVQVKSLRILALPHYGNK